MNPFELVHTFNVDVIGIVRDKVACLSDQETDWLINAIDEELGELTEAEDIVDQVDALIDLMYFSMGGLTRLGLSPMQATLCFAAVHKANMNKVRGNKGRGSDLDAVKPEEWKDPKQLIREILNLGDVKS